MRMASVPMCRDRMMLLRSWEILPHRLRELQTRVDRVRESVEAIRKSLLSVVPCMLRCTLETSLIAASDKAKQLLYDMIL